MDKVQKLWNAMVDGLSIDAKEQNDSDFWEEEFDSAPTDELATNEIDRTIDLVVSGELGNWEAVGDHESQEVGNAVFNAKADDSMAEEQRKQLIDKLKKLKKEGNGHSGDESDCDSTDGNI